MHLLRCRCGETAEGLDDQLQVVLWWSMHGNCHPAYSQCPKLCWKQIELSGEPLVTLMILLDWHPVIATERRMHSAVLAGHSIVGFFFFLFFLTASTPAGLECAQTLEGCSLVCPLPLLAASLKLGNPAQPVGQQNEHQQTSKSALLSNLLPVSSLNALFCITLCASAVCCSLKLMPHVCKQRRQRQPVPF